MSSYCLSYDFYVMTWMLFTIKLSNIFLSFPLFSLISLLNSQISLHCPPILSNVLPDFSYWSPGFLLSSHVSSLISCYPPWSLCSSHVSSLLILMMIVIKSDLLCFFPYDFMSLMLSSLVSHCFSLSSHWFPPWSPCSSHVSSIMILMMIVIKSAWWCPPLLSSACWWCFLPVLSLWSDYRGWLLIIFILNILLISCCDDIYFSHFSLLYIQNMF